MNGLRVWQYRVSRLLGRFVTRLAAWLTFGRMPPFVSASALVVADGRILVVVDSVRKEPVLPGGHLKWAEGPVQALIREVREETGYLIEAHELVDVAAGATLAGEGGVVRLIYRGTVTGGSLASSPEGEATWLSLDQLALSGTRDAAIVQRWLSATTEGRGSTAAT